MSIINDFGKRKAQMTPEEEASLETDVAYQHGAQTLIDKFGYRANDHDIEEIAKQLGLDSETLSIVYFDNCWPIVEKAAEEALAMNLDGFPITKAVELSANKYQADKDAVTECVTDRYGDKIVDGLDVPKKYRNK